MSKVNVSIACSGCESKTKVIVKKPAHFTPSFATYDCSGCGSEIFASVAKPKAKDKSDQVEVRLKITRYSPTLIELMKEEIAAKYGATTTEET